jgi:hypothetical protein
MDVYVLLWDYGYEGQSLDSVHDSETKAKDAAGISHQDWVEMSPDHWQAVGEHYTAIVGKYRVQ